MNYDDALFTRQYPLIKDFAYHYTYYRELHRAYAASDFGTEFAAYTINSHLEMAAIHWCKLFGSFNQNNPTHWKYLLTDLGRANRFEDAFRESIFKTLGLNEQGWVDYWTSIKRFRDEYVAHRTLNVDFPVPDFSGTLQVAYCYDLWVRNVIRPHVMGQRPLKEVVQQLEANIEPVAEHFVREFVERFRGI